MNNQNNDNKVNDTPNNNLKTNGYNPYLKQNIEQSEINKNNDQQRENINPNNVIPEEQIPQPNSEINRPNELEQADQNKANSHNPASNLINPIMKKGNNALNNIMGSKGQPNKLNNQNRPNSLNTNGFKNNAINNLINKKNNKQNKQKTGNNQNNKDSNNQNKTKPKNSVSNNLANPANLFNTMSKAKKIQNEGAKEYAENAVKQKIRQKMVATLIKILPTVLPFVGVALLLLVIILILLSIFIALTSSSDVGVQPITTNYCTSVKIKSQSGETATITDEEYIAYELSNSVVNNINNADVIEALSIIYRTNLYADTDNIEDNVCSVELDKDYEKPTDTKYLELTKLTSREVYTFNRTKLSNLPTTDYFSWESKINDATGVEAYTTYIDDYKYPTSWVDSNVPSKLLNQDSSFKYGFSPYMAEYLSIYEKDNDHDLLFHFYSYNPNDSSQAAYKVGTIFKIDTGEVIDTSDNSFSSSCSSISLTSTSLTKEEFVSKMNIQASSDTSHVSFYNQAATIYDVSVSQNFNPELVVLRAKAEGFSPGGSTYNYWGLGCYNGTSNCKSYSSFSEGLVAFINNVSKYSNVNAMMNKYAYIGQYWYNGSYTSSSLGGCYYYPYIKTYLSDTRKQTVDNACASTSCSKSGGGSCVATNDEDQSAYSKWQVSKMADIASNIFGTVSNDCTDDSGTTSGSNSSPNCKLFSQSDSQWGSIRLGSSNTTMSRSGCAITSIAIGLSCSGTTLKVSNFNPEVLVKKLNSGGCLNSSGEISWSCSAISEIAPSVRFNQSTSLAGKSVAEKVLTVQQAQKSNNFVILHISNSQHSSHFVVYYKTNGTNFEVKDPAGGKMSTYSASDIDSIRVYSY